MRKKSDYKMNMSTKFILRSVPTLKFFESLSTLVASLKKNTAFTS